MYFSDFGLISDFFTSTPLTIICKISTMEHFSYDFMVDSDFQKKSLFASDLTYITVLKERAHSRMLTLQCQDKNLPPTVQHLEQ